MQAKLDLDHHLIEAFAFLLLPPPLGPIILRVDGKYIQCTYSDKQRFSQEVHKFRRLNV